MLSNLWGKVREKHMPSFLIRAEHSVDSNKVNGTDLNSRDMSLTLQEEGQNIVSSVCSTVESRSNTVSGSSATTVDMHELVAGTINPLTDDNKPKYSSAAVTEQRVVQRSSGDVNPLYNASWESGLNVQRQGVKVGRESAIVDCQSSTGACSQNFQPSTYSSTPVDSATTGAGFLNPGMQTTYVSESKGVALESGHSDSQYVLSGSAYQNEGYVVHARSQPMEPENVYSTRQRGEEIVRPLLDPHTVYRGGLMVDKHRAHYETSRGRNLSTINRVDQDRLAKSVPYTVARSVDHVRSVGSMHGNSVTFDDDHDKVAPSLHQNKATYSVARGGVGASVECSTITLPHRLSCTGNHTSYEGHGVFREKNTGVSHLTSKKGFSTTSDHEIDHAQSVPSNNCCLPRTQVSHKQFGELTRDGVDCEQDMSVSQVPRNPPDFASRGYGHTTALPREMCSIFNILFHMETVVLQLVGLLPEKQCHQRLMMGMVIGKSTCAIFLMCLSGMVGQIMKRLPSLGYI